MGWDYDDSVSEHNNWEQNLGSLTRHIRSFGPETRLTIPHDAIIESIDQPNKKEAAWDRYLIHASPSLTGEEIQAYSKQPGLQPRDHWITIDPLDSRRYSLVDRVQDITERMIAVQQNAWETAWFSDPSDPKYAILDAEGGPDEMFLPLRTLTENLNNAEDFITMPMGENIKNIIYRVGNEDRMILWSNRPVEVPLYIGNEWTATDIWGRPVVPLPPKPNGQKIAPRVIQVGAWPVIIRKINRMAALWVMNVKIENPIIENRVGAVEPVRVYLYNPTNKMAAGKVEIYAPTLLQDDLASAPLSVEPNSGAAISVPIQLQPDAGQINEPVDIFITLDGHPPTQFGVKQSLNVGLKDFKLESSSIIDEQDQLVIQLTMTNESGQAANFDCMLLLPDKPRKRIQMINLNESATRTIVVDQGSAYKGQLLWLRCEEISSGRVLNHRIPVK